MNDNNNQEKSGLQKLTSKAKDVKQAIETVKKIKKYGPILSIILPILGWFLLAVLAIGMIAIPMMYIDDIKEKVATGLDKFVNLLTYGGWNTSEEVFINKLRTEYEAFENFNFKEGEFDIPLLASTVHFNTLTNPEGYSYNPDSEKGETHAEYEYDNNDPIVPKDQLRSFYTVAEDELGSGFTWMMGEKKLIGHLVDTRFSKTCVQRPEGFDIVSWLNLGATYVKSYQDFGWYVFTSVKSTGADLLSRANIFKTAQLLFAYRNQGKSYLESQFSELGYEITTNNFFAELLHLIEVSDLSDNCADDQIGVPIIERFINYDYYKEYLKEEYLPKQPYAQCDDCKYKKADNDEKEKIIDKWIDDIFEHRELYNYLSGRGANNVITTYIPGMSSLPIQIGANQDWETVEANIKRDYYDTQCYKDGVPVPGVCPHLAIDFPFAAGTPVMAIANADVLQSNYDYKGYGNYIKLGHDLNGDGKYEYYSLYAHLSVRNVEAGQKIGGGQKIGEVGDTGNSTGNHLHFEIRNEKDRNGKIDPLPILKGIASGNSALDPMSGLMTCNMYSGDEIRIREANLKDEVRNAYPGGQGYGTREGVVAAANYLAVDLGAKVPYWSGGRYTSQGFNENWGCDRVIKESDFESQTVGSSYPYGLDDRGFIYWAIRNGGYKASTIANGINIQLNSSTGSVGWDALGLKQAHIGDIVYSEKYMGIIISIDENSGSCIIAEEKDPNTGLIISKENINSTRFNKIILMNDYYNNDSNKED